MWVLRRILAWFRLVLYCLQRKRLAAFLKDFKICFARSCEDLCGIALEIVQLRITLSLETRPLIFKPWTRTQKVQRSTTKWGLCGKIRRRPCLRGKKVRSRRSDFIRRGCKARTKAPLELGAKMSDMLEEPKMDPSVNQCNGHSPGYGWLQNPKTIWHGLVTLLPFARLAGPKNRKGDPGKS